MKVAIYGRLLHPSDASYIQQLFDLLAAHQTEVLIYENFYTQLGQYITFKQPVGTFKQHSEIAKTVEYLFSLGGDGTLLDTVTLVRSSNIPIVGINIGRLGFLANIGREQIKEAMEAIHKRTYVIERRSLLRLEANKPLFGETNYALNEFTIRNRDSLAMIAVHTYINGDYLNTYRADGVIVATPTGSTAYSLSCGGPILFPKTGSFVITPVAPHHLNVRPIVVPDDSVISFEVESRNNSFLCALDSRYETIDNSYQLAIRKEEFTIHLVRLSRENFLSTLRNKLMWGADKRNYNS